MLVTQKPLERLAGAQKTRGFLPRAANAAFCHPLERPARVAAELTENISGILDTILFFDISWSWLSDEETLYKTGVKYFPHEHKSLELVSSLLYPYASRDVLSFCLN